MRILRTSFAVALLAVAFLLVPTAPLVPTALLIPAATGFAAPASPTPSSSIPGVPSSIPGIQSAAPGAPQTAPPPPQAPAEPFPWPIVVFGVLGLVLLVAWARLRRQDEADDAEQVPPEDQAG